MIKKSKVCFKCRRMKSYKRYYRDAEKEDGYTNFCKDCLDSEASFGMGEKRKRTAKLYLKEQERRLKDPVKAFVTRSLCGHKSSGYEIKITRQELTEKLNSTKRCEYCNVELLWQTTFDRNFPLAPSLDRKDNEQFLSLSNTAIVCRRCNYAKRDLTATEYIALCTAVANNNKS